MKKKPLYAYATPILELPDSRFLRKMVGRALGPGYEEPAMLSCCTVGKGIYVSCNAPTDAVDAEHAVFALNDGMTGFISALSSEVRVTTLVPRKKS